MKVIQNPLLRTLFVVVAALASVAATAQAQVTLGWNFGTTAPNAASTSGTPVNFSAGSFGIANSFGTIATPISTTSASSAYTGASGQENIGTAVHNDAFSTSTSPYFAVTLTPSAGYSLQITKFDFGMRCTATGASAYALYSSADNYTTPLFTGTDPHDSTWRLKSNGTFSLNGAASAAVTLRLYTYNGASNAGSGTITTRMDDVSITVNAIQSVVASTVSVETAADGSGTVVAAQSISANTSITAYSITRDSGNAFIADAASTWSLTNKTGGVVDGDLVASGDGKSAVFTPHAAGSAVIHSVISGVTSVDSGVITATATPTNPTAIAVSDSPSAVNGQVVNLTVTVSPGVNPASTGLAVTGDLSAIGGSSTQAFTSGSGNIFTYQATIPPTLAGGAKSLTFSVTDAQSRTGTANLTLPVYGNLTIFHTNDTHARVTPHKWIVPQHSSNPAVSHVFEDVGGISYLGAEVLALTAGQPDALVLDGGDISEGNPLGDWNGPGNLTGTYGDGTIVDYYKILNSKLKAISNRGGRGLDAMVVGNHDIRDITYFQNMRAASYVADPVNGFHLLSINICNKGTHTPYYEAYTIVNLNGSKIGIVGYTTESSDSPEAGVTGTNGIIDVVKCDWSSNDSTKIHFSDIVNDLRNNQGCNLVILLTHDGHSDLCTSSSGSTPILVDNAVGKIPEIVVSGHWHTYCDSVWQPDALNYKTIFTEAASFQHYVGELRINGAGKYASSTYYPVRVSSIIPDPQIAAYLAQRKTDYANATPVSGPAYGLDQVIGYTADDLLLDNYMKWWSADEYPWSGNNTAGNWICDAVQWKAAQLFGQCDLSMEAGGGVRSDIVAGPVTYTNIYETYPWADDIIYEVNMTGQEIWTYIQQHGCDAAISTNWHVTAYDGNPTEITFNGQPIDMAHTYKVAINNYMYLHDSVPFSDPSPQTSTYLARSALVDYTGQFTQAAPYSAGPSRYSLNTDFSGGYRAVVTMMNDADSSNAFDDGFIRMLNALPETLGHRGTPQVPSDLVNADGTMNHANRLTEIEWYRSYLGFRTGALKPGDIVEIWGKGSFFDGDPEFVDQEGIQSDGVEFKIVGHDDSLAKPTYFSSIAGFWDQEHKNHYVKFYANKTGTNSVTDKSGTTIQIQDVTAFASKTLPGNVGDLLVLTGTPTSENFALRFRCNSAALASTEGITNYPPDSHVNPASSPQSGGPLALSATATTAPGANQTFYTLEPVADSQVESGSPNANVNTTNLFIESAATGTFANERAWLRFDLSGIPSGSTISSAKLNMWCWKATGNSLPAEIHGGDVDTWGETTITWNNQPTFGSVLDTQTFASGVTNTHYTWDATAFAQTKFAGDKLVSLLVKPVTENSTDSPSPAYGFDSKEFTSTHPYLQVSVPTAGAPTSISQVQFYFRYSEDNNTWSSWTAFQTVNAAPYTTNFSYPNGEGYYEFYSVATDSTGTVEPAPALADAAVYYAPAASNLTSNGALLNGSLDPNGVDTVIHFEYGADTNYGQSTGNFDIGSGTSTVPFNMNLSGLQPNTTYHYHLVSVANGVTTDFGDQTFTTGISAAAMPPWALALLMISLVAVAGRTLQTRSKASAC